MKDNKYKFQKLTPISDIDLKVYEEAIDYIFENSDVRNVAISGAYSAGKSSVLASYKKKHSNLKFVNISLAHFKSNDEVNETEVKESILEGKILNQLIHQIPSNKIPQTNFKVKKKVNPNDIKLSTALIMLFILSFLHMILFNLWKSYVLSLPNNWLIKLLSLSINQYSLLVSGLLCAIIFSIFMYCLVKTQKNKNVFRKISLQGNEIEIFEESDESYFDKYLNEVLYIFENVEVDVVVFEDIDRFNANRIFERLREINTLVNIQLKKDNKSLIRFFYLLRDDIFISKDRTKFFDYIVPIVPVLDSTNSYDQFILHFKKGGIFEQFEESFLQGLSLYIDDMRILKNIYNEFVIYYNRLNTTELDCNKMLSMIVYKNLFPRDFSDLQLNQGMVFTIFDKKDDFIKERINNLNEQVVKKKKEIKLAKEEHLTNIQEIEDVYNAKRTRVSNSNYQQRQQQLEQYNKDYAIRKQAIQNNLNNRLPELEDELSQLEQEIIITQSKQLKDIITRENIDLIFKVTSTNEIGIETNFYEIKGSEYFNLLKYFIRNGYIDETYTDYMTYFYENSLSRVDKTFLRSITDKKAKEYTYKLKNPKLLISRLQLMNFDQEEILNFDLLQFLLQTPEQVSYLNRFLAQLKETKNFKFIGLYLDTEKELSAFVKYLNLQWPEMFNIVLKEVALSEKQIRLYSLYTLYYSDVNNLKAVNTEDCLTKYIANSRDYLNVYNPNTEILINRFGLLKVSFKGIDYDISNKELFFAVYQNCLYDINFKNLELMLKKVYNIENEDNIHHKNYTLILIQPDSALAQYVNMNIEIYIDVILQNICGRINDDENVLLRILNHDVISIDQKNTYIESLQTSITNIVEVENKDLWCSLLERNLVQYSEENIVEFFERSELLDSELIRFINSKVNNLDFIKVRSTYGDEKAGKFFDAVTICNELSNNKYKEILVSIGFCYDNFNFSDISEEKLLILIEEKIIRMNLETLKYLRENYKNQVLYFIEKNIVEYSDIISRDSFVYDELIEILSWDISDEIKIKLISLTNEPISIISKTYTNVVNIYILNNNIMEDNIPNLFKSYDKWESSIQEVVYSLAIKNIDYIITDSNNVSVKLLKSILSSSDLNINKKVDLFVVLLPKVDEKTCIEYINLLALVEFNKIFEPRTRPKFEINTINEKLLTAFKDNKLIANFEEDQEKGGSYKIIRNKIPPIQLKSLPTKLL